MLFMNEWEIDLAADRHRTHPVLGPATRFLRQYVDEVNAHSDGWPYWSQPVRAAKQLLLMLEAADAGFDAIATEAQLKKALAPIKAFMTKRGKAAGMTMPELR